MPHVHAACSGVQGIMTDAPTTPEFTRAASTPSDADVAIYFDGSCPLCSFEISHYARQRGADKFVFIDASDLQTSMDARLGRGDAMKRFHVRAADGRLLSGAEAFVAVWDVLPGWRWAARIARLPGALLALEAAYRVFLPLRPWLSRLAARLGARAFRTKEPGVTDA